MFCSVVCSRKSVFVRKRLVFYCSVKHVHLQVQNIGKLFSYYSTVSLEPPIFAVDVWSGITCNNLMSPLKREIQSTINGHSCDCEISVLSHCLSWSKFVNIHLSYSSQWFNIHLSTVIKTSLRYHTLRAELNVKLHTHTHYYFIAKFHICIYTIMN